MDQFLLQEAIKLNKRRKYRQWWKRFVRVVAMVVVFCTTYALILPAITMHTETLCGFEEHSHTETCYVPELSCLSQLNTDTVVHVHSALCYEADGTLRCTLPERSAHAHDDTCYNRQEIWICQLEETPGHSHEDVCYEHTEEPICGQQEREPHLHTELCYGEEELICALEETDGHDHGETCYELQQVLICPLPECDAHFHAQDCYETELVHLCGREEAEPHNHTDVCYTDEKTCICEREELEAHAHSDACYTVNTVMLCTLAEEEAHAHGEGCYEVKTTVVCQQEESEEHTHGEGCVVQEQVFICTRVETAGHSHGDSCKIEERVLTCALQETEGHQHDDACYQQDKKLTCTMEETEGHTHDETCTEERQNLVCEDPETEGHHHDEACYGEEAALVCGLEVTAPHAHSEQCFTKPLICQLEETEGHAHEDSCFLSLICNLEEFPAHSHDESCVEVTEELICQTPEIILSNHTGEGLDGGGMPAYVAHEHTESCLGQRLICELTEHLHEEACYPIEETAPTDPGFLCGFGRHTHGEGCFGEDGVLVCTVPEHTHSAPCVVADYDANANVENEEVWKSTFSDVLLTGDWPADVLAIAQTQLDYKESRRNVVLQGDGTLNGYTRYGHWYGLPHGDWCAMYVAFCMHYAGVEHYPVNSGCQNWINELKEQNLYRLADSYVPKPGDIVFFDRDRNESSDHVGLVTILEPQTEESPAMLHTIEGNAADRVQNCTYDPNDPSILGYGVMPLGKLRQMEFRGQDYAVSVSFGADALIPADAQLVVREIPQGTEEYQYYYEQSVQVLQTPSEEAAREITFARFFDISFQVEGQSIEPATPVGVTISYEDAVELTQADTGLAIHFADEGVEVLDAQTNETVSETEQMADTFTFTQGSFSVTGTVISASSARASTQFDLYNALKIEEVVSSIRVTNGSGAETKIFANGDDFSVILDCTVQGYQFNSNQPKTLYFTLPNTMKLSSYTCSDTVSAAAIDSSSNTFLMTVDPVAGQYGYESVSFQLVLNGRAVNQTGGVSYVTIRWEQYQIFGAKQEYSCVTSDGAVISAQIMGTNYPASAYDLIAEPVDPANYLGNIRSFVSGNYSRRDVDSVAMYQVYLQSKSNPGQRTPLGNPYVLTIELPQNQLPVSSGGMAITINMNNGSANKPSGSSAQIHNHYVSKASISDQYNSLSQFAVVSLTGITEGTTGSGYSLQFNDQTDAFIKDPAFAKYYNANSPIGTAGSFHIVAFDTANLETHTNGNILAKNLVAGSNFGTNNYDHELTYVQNYLKINSNSASDEDHVLVIGSENELGLYDNNNKYTINGQPIDRPKNIIQDQNTATAPFINLNRVRAEITQIAANLVNYEDMNLDITVMDQKNVVHLTDPDTVGVLNVKATDDRVFGKDYIQLSGFESGHEGSIVINVDCSGVSEIQMPKALVVVDGVEQSTNEVVEFSNGKVLWNFINAQGVTINTHLMTGMVIAPGASVNVMQNLNGTVVADVVNIKAESHRTDFTGKILPHTQTESHTVTIQKTRAGYVGTTLANAQFDLYIWSWNGWTKVNTQPIVTNSNGLFRMEELQLNTAYQLVETVAPSGYVLMEEPCYFWVRSNSSATAPALKPDGFTGSAISSGGVLNIFNELDEQVRSTSLVLKKHWEDGNITNVSRVAVYVYQISWRDGVQIDKQLYKSVILSDILGWEVTVTDLPLNSKSDDGTEITYTYTVEEAPVEGYTASYDIDTAVGVTEGKILITNRTEADEPAYVLPETGGSGIWPPIICGASLMVFAMVYFLLLHWKRRRETPS